MEIGFYTGIISYIMRFTSALIKDPCRLGLPGTVNVAHIGIESLRKGSRPELVLGPATDCDLHS